MIPLIRFDTVLILKLDINSVSLKQIIMTKLLSCQK